MPVEIPPERGAIWLENWVLSATVAGVTSQHVNYQAENLLTPHRSASWRTTTGTGINQVIFDMGQLRTPACLALTDVNFSNGDFIQVIASDDSAQTVNVTFWYLPLYPQDQTGKVLRWYFGDPTSGSIGASTNPADPASSRGRRYWAVRMRTDIFTYNLTDSFFEIGVVWLGEYVPIRPWAGTRIRPRDPSTRARAYGGAQWSDPLPPYREADVSIGGLTMADAYDLEARIRAQGPKHAVLDVHAFSGDAVMKRGGCLYGYFPDDPCEIEVDSPEMNSLRLRFEEARG